MMPSQDSPSRPRLSVAMIVRNEADVLADSVESVRSIADEIVVLDTGSTDETLAVARRLGVALASTPWDDTFSAARNHCLGLATGDWVLWLDAGERLSEGSAAELRHFVDQQADTQKVYTLLVEVPPLEPAASAEQAAQVRLIPNRPELRFEGRVRETYLPSIEAAGMMIAAAPGRILRHPRQHDLALKVIKAKRDLALATAEAAERGESSRLLLAMGEAYSNLGLHEQARATFRRAIEAAEPGSIDMLEAYYGLLAAFDGNPYLQDLQLSTCLEALEIFAVDAQLLLAMGSYLQGHNRLDLAIQAYRTAVQHGWVEPRVWHLRELTEVAAVCLSVALQMQDAADEACRALEQTLQRHPNSTRLLRRLLDVNAQLSRCDEALAVADRLAPSPEHCEPLRNAVRGACKAAEKQWTAALGYLQSAYAAGCHDPFCLRWLAVTLLSNGQTEAARPVLHEWQGIEPTNVELGAYLKALEGQQAMPPANQRPVTATLPPGETLPRRFRVDAGCGILSPTTVELPAVDRNNVSSQLGSS
jgi:glycosyltransferase involved in cell wall biosynthesis